MDLIVTLKRNEVNLISNDSCDHWTYYMLHGCINDFNVRPSISEKASNELNMI